MARCCTEAVVDDWLCPLSEYCAVDQSVGSRCACREQRPDHGAKTAWSEQYGSFALGLNLDPACSSCLEAILTWLTSIVGAQSRHCHPLLPAYLISSTPERVRIDSTRSASPAYPQILSIRRQISILAQAATIEYHSTPHRFIWQTAAEPSNRASEGRGRYPYLSVLSFQIRQVQICGLGRAREEAKRSSGPDSLR
ncbi:predicted protein [Pyrenophora tritici-repentis Pt-1C-BFP]|uniref:Uncharacterized protein n=1 Tax=Pyrenophora tritici-repentis (strain Pt-1C-BFP) TaxID=426418 RepID=B2WMC8_PYRTR|nr:uncharacterized protein PTRG_11138 [Pyrenophora tritici-repentis Pt-1C-BFP]EDU44188.1 predicted protein [Pyrenophora tritici-repentis Pt-1C-BFP]